jgi:hypothetical protein
MSIYVSLKCSLTCLVNVIHLLKFTECPKASLFRDAAYAKTFLKFTIEEYVWAAAAALLSSFEEAVV